jgi:hypothetical protein
MNRRALAVLVLATFAGCGGPAAGSAVSRAPDSSARIVTTTSPAPTAATEPTAAPTTAPSVSVTWAEFRSKRFAFSIDYPVGWIVTDATADWPQTGWPDPHGKAVDRFSPDADDDPQVTISSDVLEPGEVALGRRAEIDQESALACRISNDTTITVDGEAARRQDAFCFEKDYDVSVFVDHGGRIYLIDWLARVSITDQDRALFDAMLARFRFGS